MNSHQRRVARRRRIRAHLSLMDWALTDGAALEREIRASWDRFSPICPLLTRHHTPSE